MLGWRKLVRSEHYRTGRFEMPRETIEACGYLESLSPREELASFLCQRGECWMQDKNFGEAVTAFAWANELDSRRQQHAFLTEQAMGQWKLTLHSRLPSRLFPKLDLGLPESQFHRMPRNVEREIIGLRVHEGLLNDQVLERRWWAPLRKNPTVKPSGMPDTLSIDFQWNTPNPQPTLHA